MQAFYNVPFFLYLAVNAMFVYKYGARLEGYAMPLCIFYVVFIGCFPLIYRRIKLKDSIFKYIFYGLITFFLCLALFINHAIDGNSLQVDRWSAIHVAIEALLNGDYPYAAVDHLNGRTSNLPTLIFIGIPFYLLGSVGYLQAFCFLVFSYVIHNVFDTFKKQLFCLLLLVLAPSYLWEIYVKSDLMSNMILVVLFTVWARTQIENTKQISSILISFLAAALVLTRLTVIIPLILVLFPTFYKLSTKEKLKFIAVALTTTLIFAFICFQHVGSWQNFADYNPFELQNRQLPTLVSLLFIILPILASFYIKNLKMLLGACAVFLAIPVLVAFALNLYNYGIFLSVMESYFDLSYFNIFIPFLILYITLKTPIFFAQKPLSQPIKTA